ncbi:Peptidoglycan-binding domain 1 protein [Lachnoclostridium phytofermentans ISDg]|uniref:Peptidoglycan-binding domain 1 protein n=2 Tax=Lachnoclostridium phytofermentans TaxID=66219 RepID=A9KI92_LACP7|nr:peptidoglycan-binding protein [Lachnoclostridium phytofermentans]ABX40926.1 Peptidoglycan-binding domain 1 protein [Lachnoclostridium phytofermentans ISDg]
MVYNPYSFRYPTFREGLGLEKDVFSPTMDNQIPRTNMMPRNDYRVYPAQVETQSLGGLVVDVLSARDNRPISNATVGIQFTGDPSTQPIEELQTSDTGRTELVELPAPPVDYSLEPSAPMPYSEYTLTIKAPGFEPVIITGAQILPTVNALQNILLDPTPSAGVRNTAEAFVIPYHTLYGDYPPKILEDEIKPLEEAGEIVLPNVVIPEFIVVHDGVPTDKTAKDYWVPYRDYIKNVASSEIYATWPESTIYANVLAIQSFTLNRVFTEWYRNKGFSFTITSSTAYDHKFMPGRNFFDSISRVVDTIFNNYLSRPNVKQPILTQYCDGKRVSCPEVMTQWGSKTLGDQGYTPIQILRYYYGDSIYINTTYEVSGVPVSFPGYNLTIGSSGSSVMQLQEQLNAIADVYYPIPNVSADGIFGPATAAAVKAFQKQFNLPQSGIVDLPTWYKISGIYVAITRMAEYQ